VCQILRCVACPAQRRIIEEPADAVLVRSAEMQHAVAALCPAPTVAVAAMLLAAPPEVIRVPSTVASLRLALKVSLTWLGQAPMMWGLRQHHLD